MGLHSTEVYQITPHDRTLILGCISTVIGELSDMIGHGEGWGGYTVEGAEDARRELEKLEDRLIEAEPIEVLE